MSEFVTHNVRRFVVERPEGYDFIPGQATKLSINKPDWKNKGRPFTFTSLEEDHVLEFTIKGYYDHEGVTNHLHQLKPGDELVVRDAWGTINYTGPGVFLAGGAGVTPFIAILRRLREDGQIDENQLIFSNRTAADVILEKEFRHMLGENFTSILTQDQQPGHEHGRIDKEYLQKTIDDFSQNFYVCGPKKFTKDIKGYLSELGAETESIVIEE
jgi:hypothetical protein